jgi:hypothetical protein
VVPDIRKVKKKLVGIPVFTSIFGISITKKVGVWKVFKKFEMSICYNTVRRGHGVCGVNGWLCALAGGQVEPLIPIYVKYTVTKVVYLLFIHPDLYSPNGNSHLDQNASIDADFLKEVSFGVSRFAKKLLRVKFSPKIEKNFHHCTNMTFLNNF